MHTSALKFIRIHGSHTIVIIQNGTALVKIYLRRIWAAGRAWACTLPLGFRVVCLVEGYRLFLGIQTVISDGPRLPQTE